MNFGGIGAVVCNSASITRNMGSLILSGRVSVGGNQQNKIPLVVGSWYLFQYGSSPIKGKCVRFNDDTAVIKFYWGHPFRTSEEIDRRDIIEETTKPKWYSNH